MLHQKVLVLNQSYEPLSVCTVRRAVVLIFLGKAEMVSPLDHQYLRSVRTDFPVPSIVRLLLHKKVPIKKIVLSRKNVLIRDNFQCQYCGRKNVLLTVDHVVPRDRGGDINWENLVCACVKCNNKKGNRNPDEADMNLLKPPRKPNHIMFLRYFVETVNDDWKQYLFIED